MCVVGWVPQRFLNGVFVCTNIMWNLRHTKPSTWKKLRTSKPMAFHLMTEKWGPSFYLWGLTCLKTRSLQQIPWSLCSCSLCQLNSPFLCWSHLICCCLNQNICHLVVCILCLVGSFHMFVGKQSQFWLHCVLVYYHFLLVMYRSKTHFHVFCEIQCWSFKITFFWWNPSHFCSLKHRFEWLYHYTIITCFDCNELIAHTTNYIHTLYQIVPLKNIFVPYHNYLCWFCWTPIPWPRLIPGGKPL